MTTTTSHLVSATCKIDRDVHKVKVCQSRYISCNEAQVLHLQLRLSLLGRFLACTALAHLAQKLKQSLHGLCWQRLKSGVNTEIL